MTDPYIKSLLGEKERIILEAHQHLFLLFSTIGWEIATIIVIIVAVILVSVLVPALALIAPFGLFLLVIPLVGVLVDLAYWLNRKYIVTNRRVISISGVFNKNVVDSSLEKVNDVKMEQSFLGRMFNYGDIEILTASELGVNLFQKISFPIRFKTAMLNAKESMAMDDDGSGRRREAGGYEIPEMIARLDELRKQGILSDEEFQQKKAELLRKIE